MNSKAGIGLWIGIFLALLFVGAIIAGLILANNRGMFNKTPEQKTIPTMPLYIKGMEEGTNKNLSSNYAVEVNHTIISHGILDAGRWLSVDVPIDSLPNVYCWDNNHYTVKAVKMLTADDMRMNRSTLSCDMVKIGKLTIQRKGSIDSTMNSITLNLSSNDWFYRVGLCFAWTVGIIDVQVPSQTIQCSSGSWKNYSDYNATSKTYTWLPNATYYCDSYGLEKCENVNTNTCKVLNEEIPSRFKGKVDSCFYTGKTITPDSSLVLTFNVKTDNYKDSLDQLTIYVYDKDRRYNEATHTWDWVSEVKGQDISAQDQNVTIRYQEAA